MNQNYTILKIPTFLFCAFLISQMSLAGTSFAHKKAKPHKRNKVGYLLSQVRESELESPKDIDAKSINDVRAQDEVEKTDQQQGEGQVVGELGTSFLAPDTSLRPRLKKIYWQFRFATGFASFPDIQTPQNFLLEEEGRADGSVVQASSDQHSSIPLEVAAIYHYQTSPKTFLNAGLNYLYLSNLRGNPESAHSSYQSTGLQVDFTKEWPELNSLNNFVPRAGLGLEANRSRYMNISSGHFNDTLSPTLNLNLASRKLPLELQFTGAYALWSQFKYYPGNLGSASVITGSKVNQYSIKTSLEYQITPDASLDLALSRQVTEVDIPNVNSYDRFGLTVFSDQEQEHLSLITNTVQLGVSKYF